MGGLFVVGERPGVEECERGSPFVGRSGDWINAGLGTDREIGPEALRLWRPFEKPLMCLGCPLYEKGKSFVPGAGNMRVFVSNVRRCWHEDETEAEKAASIAHCTKAYLNAEIARVAPRAIVTVGGDALRAVVGTGAMQRYHGSAWTRAAVDEIRQALGLVAEPLPPETHTVVATIHPAHAMRAGIPQLKPSIVAAVLRAKRWSERLTGPRLDWRFSLEPTAQELGDILDAATWAAVDVETQRENHGHIDLCGASTADGFAVVTPWTPEYREVWRDWLGRPVLKVGHNISFDRNAFAANGMEVEPPVQDTIRGAALLDPVFKGAKRFKWLNLPTCAIRMIDGLANWKDPSLPETKAYYRANFPDVPEFLHARLYNGIDCVVTRLLANAQKDALQFHGMW